MASLLTTDELREHFETDLKDAAVQRLIDDAESEIDERIGQLATGTDTFEGDILATALFLSRRAKTITTATEEIRSGGGYQTTVLDPTDYKLRYEGRQIERLTSGVNPRSTWGDIVTVVYVPEDDTNRRKRVAVDLVKLAAQYSALDSEKIGDYSAKSAKYEAHRSEILARLESWSWA